jgi:hypothetical protein
MGKKLGIAVVAAVFLVGAALIFLFFSPSKTAGWAALPNPNGYDDFRDAARTASVSAASVSDMTVAELQTYVEKEAKALELVKRGLKKECAVPVGYSNDWMKMRIPEMKGFKALSSILNAEARLIANTNAVAGARAYVESLRFAAAVGRGGLIIDHLIGLSFQHAPAKKLKELKDQLSEAEAREIFDAVEKIYRNRQSAKEVVARDIQWARMAGDWRSQVAILVRPGLIKGMTDDYMGRARAGEDEIKVLLIDYATRIQEIDKGKKHEDLKKKVAEFRKRED